jgi:hypothetical protein
MSDCEHKRIRLLWAEPKESRDAFEEYNPEGLDLKEFWEKNNITICCD